MATKKEKPLKEQFNAAKARIEALSRRPTNEQLLDLYGLYKQSTDGDVTGDRPGLLDIKGRSKFDAWAKRKGTSREDAMKKYVALVDKLVAEPG